ncbi:MAG: pitrilysin family protein [bacterium]
MKRSAPKAVITACFFVALLTTGCAELMEKFEKALDKTQETESREPGQARKGSPEKVKKVLDNGLTVVVQESYGAPVTSVQVWVKAGSADEQKEEAGIAHLIEHMMFKGTRKRGVGETAREVESLGGDMNAFTSYDQTVYYITIASRFSDEAVEILSDLVLHPVFDEKELDREREVVLEEIRRGKDNPSSRIFKYCFAEAYRVHPYGRPVIGYEETVKDFDREDILEFYNRYYTAPNMTVVISGDVVAEDVMKKTEQYFGEAPSNEAPAMSERPRAKAEPEQKDPRAGIFREDVTESYLYMGFHIPEFTDQDTPALDVLSVLLGGGESSRLLYRVRTERGLVNRIWAYAYTPRDEGMLLVGANLDEGKADDAISMILKQLYLLKHEKVDEWELEKAKLTLETDAIYSRETVQGQARRTGFFYVLSDDFEFEKKYLEAVRNVTAKDVREVAKKFIKGENLTVAGIFPDHNIGNSEADSSPAGFDEKDVQEIIQKTAKWDKSYSKGDLTEPRPIEPPEVPEKEKKADLSVEGKSASPPVKYDLKNGIRLIVRENPTVPLVSVRAAFDGGLRRETPDNNGINNFIAETITEGTVHYSSSEIHSMIEARGGSLEGFSGRNTTGVTLEVPSIFFRSCLPLFSEVIRYPTFPEEEVERKRGIIISSIQSDEDKPRVVAFKLFRSELFRKHPYGMDMKGTKESVKALSRQNLLDYYQNFAVPTNLVIAVVGDVEAEEVKKDFEELFQDWVADPYSPEPVQVESPPQEPRHASVCKDANQANLIIGFQGTEVTSSDRYPLELLDSVLSGMSGRLFTELRGKQSLAYAVTSFSQEGLDPGYFGVYIGTAPGKEKTAREGIMEELREVRRTPASEDELERARNVLIGDFEIQLQRYRNQALQYALDELYGLGFRASEHYPQKIESVSGKDVKRVAEKYLDPDAPVTAVVKPCEPQAKESGGGQAAGLR